MIVIDSTVANKMADYQRKHGKRMSIEEIKKIADVKETMQAEDEQKKTQMHF